MRCEACDAPLHGLAASDPYGGMSDIPDHAHDAAHFSIPSRLCYACGWTQGPECDVCGGSGPLESVQGKDVCSRCEAELAYSVEMEARAA